MRRIRTAGAVWALIMSTGAWAAPQNVLISEFRVRGPAGGNDEFVELLNVGTTAVNLTGWQLIGCASGTPGNESLRTTITDAVSLEPGAHYLFANTASSGYSGAVTPDKTYSTGFTDFGTTNFSGIRLRDANGVLQDGVGAPNSPCREGAGLLTPTANPAAQTSFRRLAEETSDIDDNGADFGPEGVADIDHLGAVTPPPPPPAAFKRVHEIQGAQHRSPLEGQRVRTRGLVTTVFDIGASNKGFYLQDPDGDGDDRTSEGLLVFTGSTAPTVVSGQEVSVTGTVTEFRPGGESTLNLTTTELTSPTVVVESGTMFSSSAVVATILGAGGRAVPTQLIDDDTVGGDIEVAASTVFDPANDGVDFYESLEGMRVRIQDGLVTGPTNGFGEVFLVPDGGVGATGLNGRGGIALTVDAQGAVDYNPERVQIDDEYFRTAAGDMPAAKVGDTASAIEGVVTYNFGNFEVLPTTRPSFVDGGTQREVTSIASSADRLTVANFNVENLDPSDGAERFAALASMIVTNLGAPDIVALQEVQDNSGAANDGTTASDQTLALLTDAIRNSPAVSQGPQYSAFDIAPVDGTVGGEPGGNIRVAYLYKADRVRLVAGTVGSGDATTATVPTTDADGALQLTFSPGLVDPTNPAFDGSRRPLAALFEFNGHRLVTINNHWSSKGGSSPILGRTQPFVNGGEDARMLQAQAVRTFIDQVLEQDAQAKILVLGDMNEFSFNAPVEVLTAPAADGGDPAMVDLADALIADPAERYSYVFEGNAQSLDHLLASQPLVSPLVSAQFDAVHVNSEFPDQISDHDPDIASFLLPRPAPVLTCTVRDGDNVIDRRDSLLPQVIAGKKNRRNVIFGSRYADLITGSERGDCIDGGAGPDLIFGLAGDDTLIGGEGIDILSGGPGADAIDGGAGRDAIDGGAGIDQCVRGSAEESDLVSGCERRSSRARSRCTGFSDIDGPAASSLRRKSTRVRLRRA